ncbi:MAG: RIP metalloprotease, partial [Alphaproteobacteria bacterium]
VLRGGQKVTVKALHPQPPLVDSVMPQSAAARAGLEPGDLITAVDGKPVVTFRQLQQAVEAADGAPLRLTVLHAGSEREVTLSPQRKDLPTADGGFETRWLIGITGGLTFVPATESPGVVAALENGVGTVGYIVRASLSGIWHMVTAQISSCNLRGVITIAETSGEAASQGSASFLWFIAVLSTAIGLLNLFPIPVLDGGHLMFHTWEALTGRPPSPRVLNALTVLGLAVVLSIMALGLANDIFCP